MNTTTKGTDLTMYTMVEALVRERLHEQERAAQRARLVRELTAARRWQRRQEKARAAHERHRLRVEALHSTVVEWA